MSFEVLVDSAQHVSARMVRKRLSYASGVTQGAVVDASGMMLAALRVEGAGIAAGFLDPYHVVNGVAVPIYSLSAGTQVRFATALSTSRVYAGDPAYLGPLYQVRFDFSVATTGIVTVTLDLVRGTGR